MVVNYANSPRIENQDSENCDHNATYGATLTCGMDFIMLFEKEMETDYCGTGRLLALFKSINHCNYTKEAVNLLLQYYYTLNFCEAFCQHKKIAIQESP